MLVVFGPCCVCMLAHVCALPSTYLRSILACFLCCEHQNPIHPPDPDPPLPSANTATHSSFAPLQGAVERPQNTLPLPGRALAPLGHWSGAAGGQLGVEGTVGDGSSVAGISCSTMTTSEGLDRRWLLRTPRGQRPPLGCCCPGLVARLRRLILRTWCGLSVLDWGFRLMAFNPVIIRKEKNNQPNWIIFILTDHSISFIL